MGFHMPVTKKVVYSVAGCTPIAVNNCRQTEMTSFGLVLTSFWPSSDVI